LHHRWLRCPSACSPASPQARGYDLSVDGLELINQHIPIVLADGPRTIVASHALGELRGTDDFKQRGGQSVGIADRNPPPARRVHKVPKASGVGNDDRAAA